MEGSHRDCHADHDDDEVLKDIIIVLLNFQSLFTVWLLVKAILADNLCPAEATP
jgi:hypothetical protein